MRTLAKWLSIWIVLLGQAHAADDAVTKEVTGEAAIIDGNKQKAQEAAKDNALRTAVEQVAGTMISATTLTQNSQLISDQILSHSAGYVSHWEPVGKPVEEAGVMKVTIKATVATTQLDKDLVAVQALITKLGNRKLVILTQEQTLDAANPNAVVNTQVVADVLSEAFKKDGWTLIDPHFAAGKLKLQAGAAGLGVDQAKEIGDLTKADYILYGSASFRNQPPIFSPAGGKQVDFPVSGEYDLAFFDTSSGNELAKISGKLTIGRPGEPEMAAAKRTVVSYERTAYTMVKLKSDEIIQSVRGKVIEYLRNAEQNGNRVVMNVTGLQEYAAVQGFKKVLADSVTGVRKVSPGSFGNGKAVFDITFVGSTDDLAERIGGKTFKGKKISVTGVTGTTVEVTLAK